MNEQPTENLLAFLYENTRKLTISADGHDQMRLAYVELVKRIKAMEEKHDKSISPS